MKVSQAIQSFRQHHRLNSKKKYAQELSSVPTLMFEDGITC